MDSFRAPAFPLITHTPYFSIWSFDDDLVTGCTRHWTGRRHTIRGYVRVDGKTYRYMGEKDEFEALKAVSSSVRTLSTEYVMQGAGIELDVTFTSPLLPDDLELMSRPATYIDVSVKSVDGGSHSVDVYLEISNEVAVESANQNVYSSRHRLAALDVVSTRSVEQPVLARSGDDLRIDWGTLFLAVEPENGTATSYGDTTTLRSSFTIDGSVPTTDELSFPRSVREGWNGLAASHRLAEVGDKAVVAKFILAYDEELAVEYFGRPLPPYWRRNSVTPGDMLSAAAREHEEVLAKVSAFEAETTARLTKAGGEGFAQLCNLAYRQCIAAHTFVEDIDGTLLMFSKENFSNGCICTVDVTYPGSPFFLVFNPELLKAQIEPIMAYAASSRWKFPFAPHDLGTYPLANGQVYGGGERNEDDQMPVEECGNMLVLVAAYCRKAGSTALASKYIDVLIEWANYLLEAGLDPENQLCTDDFAGHMAHNANLSLKAIMGLGSFAWICSELGLTEKQAQYRTAAEEMASKWVSMAEDGDHYKLAFDKSGTWSQKYNIVWDKLMGLNLFDPSLVAKEVASYIPRIQKYGLALDNRSEYTKLDWCVWTATLATNRQDFTAMVEPLVKWAHETPSRVPLTDWYWVTDGKQVGFQARSVVGGLFLPLLESL